MNDTETLGYWNSSTLTASNPIYQLCPPGAVELTAESAELDTPARYLLQKGERVFIDPTGTPEALMASVTGQPKDPTFPLRMKYVIVHSKSTSNKTGQATG